MRTIDIDEIKLDDSYYDYEDLGDEIEMEFRIQVGLSLSTPCSKDLRLILQSYEQMVFQELSWNILLMNVLKKSLVSARSETRQRFQLTKSSTTYDVKNGFKGFTRSIFVYPYLEG